MSHNIDSNGFALIGVILIFVVIGALLSIGTRLIKPSAQKHLRIETIDTVRAAKDAVIGYAAANRKLPLDTEFSSIAKNPKDAYGKDLIYVYDGNLATDICGRNTTGFAVSSQSNIAFLVLSGFDNYTVDSNPGSSGSFSGTATVDNKDRAEWVSLNQLQILVGCAESATGSRVIILNNSLPDGIKKSVYSAAMYADGGVPFSSGGDYKWCWTSPESTGDLNKLITLTCSGTTLSKSSACSLAAGTWQQCTSLLATSGQIDKDGRFDYTFYAKDDDGNIDQRHLELTVYKDKYKVWNDVGNDYDFEINGTCGTVNDGGEITHKNNLDEKLKYTMQVDRYDTTDGSCGGSIQASLTYGQARLADTDVDGKVNFSNGGTDK